MARDLLIVNGTVIAETHVLPLGYVHVQDDRIASIGSMEELPAAMSAAGVGERRRAGRRVGEDRLPRAHRHAHARHPRRLLHGQRRPDDGPRSLVLRRVRGDARRRVHARQSLRDDHRAGEADGHRDGGPRLRVHAPRRAHGGALARPAVPRRPRPPLPAVSRAGRRAPRSWTRRGTSSARSPSRRSSRAASGSPSSWPGGGSCPCWGTPRPPSRRRTA